MVEWQFIYNNIISQSDINRGSTHANADALSRPVMKDQARINSSVTVINNQVGLIQLRKEQKKILN